MSSNIAILLLAVAISFEISYRLWDQNYYVWVCIPSMVFHWHWNRWPWM